MKSLILLLLFFSSLACSVSDKPISDPPDSSFNWKPLIDNKSATFSVDNGKFITTFKYYFSNNGDRLKRTRSYTIPSSSIPQVDNSYYDLKSSDNYDSSLYFEEKIYYKDNSDTIIINIKQNKTSKDIEIITPHGSKIITS